MIKTPVAFLIFKRPDTTEKVFEAIREAKPPKLLVVADGPRAGSIGEAQKCAATRAIIDRVDWDCEVLTNYADANMGCKKRVSSGLDWVFNTVEEAIILEDDCWPQPTFFRFCEELLDKYRDDERIMVVAGNNFQYGRKRTSDSYYFSRYNHCWGWASWRRAWQHYDNDMRLWPIVRDGGWLNDFLSDSVSVKFWTQTFQDTYEGKINSWAYNWTFTCWIHNGLTILPQVNLISNIGHVAEATHTQNKASKFANMPVEAVDFPLQHPPFMMRDEKADSFTQLNNFYDPRIGSKIKRKVKALLKK
ncbi:MAG TPA: hemolytic protein HlpA-like protein [Microcoleaceae bacterium UBA10368]|jgi:hypothetical protein|nr:hemolytic protein HlpA-like protein [Microcoleaceae cyanobacterium UBA10368]HCV31114.1 hemolytic protein HlpA-like protein [Microcoleaceae cyanobacterium UBA9251]